MVKTSREASQRFREKTKGLA